MSEKPNDGGPAFPIQDAHPDANGDGQSLRDAFASAAGDEAFRILDAIYGPEWKEWHWDSICEKVAEIKYQIADAMLVEREKEKNR